MQMDAKTTWWLTFALVAVQGLNSIAWASFGVDPHIIAGISQGVGYLTTLLLFAIHGTIPGVNPVQMPRAAAAALAIGLSAVALGWASPADAQGKLTGNPIKDIGSAVNQAKPAPAGTSALDDLAAKIRKLSLDDFKYAAALAHATSNNVTAPCWDVWVKLLTAQQQPLNGADGTPLKEPDPHLATDIERLSEMIHQLLPNSELSVACAPMASAAQKDAGTLIGAVLNGGALGLFKLPFAIP
jgi:hypothetical protein